MITSLIQSAKLNGHDPYAYFKDVLTRLLTHKQRDIDQLLPHRWQPQSKTAWRLLLLCAMAGLRVFAAPLRSNNFRACCAKSQLGSGSSAFCANEQFDC